MVGLNQEACSKHVTVDTIDVLRVCRKRVGARSAWCSVNPCLLAAQIEKYTNLESAEEAVEFFQIGYPLF